MASTYTSRIKLEKQGDGENANTWGLRLNENVIDLVDEAVAGYETIDISGGATTLTSNSGASDQARNFGLKLTGSLSADTTVTIPAQEKIYFVKSSTTGGNNVIFKPAGGTAVTAVGDGGAAIVANTGSAVDVVGIGGFESGTKMLFQQSTAPLGWTKDTTHNDKAIRIVSGSTGSGGSVAFETAFGTQAITGTVSSDASGMTISGSVSATVLTESQMPTHTHLMFDATGDSESPGQTNLLTSVEQVHSFNQSGADNANKYVLLPSTGSADVGKSGSAGSSTGHTHDAGNLSVSGSITSTFTGDSLNLDVQYVDVIIATKD